MDGETSISIQDQDPAVPPDKSMDILTLSLLS
jgi:hypothetical protein